MTLEGFLQGFAASLAHVSMYSLAVATVAGVLASSVCPCTLPMGLSVAGVVGSVENGDRRRGFLIAAAFFAGIVTNLVVLSMVAARIGAVLTESFGRNWALAMAVVSLVGASIALYGPRLRADQLGSWRTPGVVGAFFYGFVFSLGTSAAPLLVLLTVAAAQASPATGVLLAMAFGIGRGLPFLLVGVFAGALIRFTQVGHWRRAIQVLSALALLAVSVYFTRTYLALL